MFDPSPIEKEYCVRFYRWALKDSLREVEQDYPLLSKIPSAKFLSFVQMSRELPFSERIALANALVKHGHRMALSYLGESLTGDEKNYAEQITQYVRAHDSEMIRNLRGLHGHEYRPPSKKQFIARVVERLRPVLGDRVEKDVIIEGSARCFITQVGDWFVRTSFDYLAKYGVNIEHQVIVLPTQTGGMDGNYTHRHTNIGRWWGLGNFYWEILPQNDLSATFDAIAAVCGHFVQQIPLVLEGLPLPDPEVWSKTVVPPEGFEEMIKQWKKPTR